MAHLLRDLLDPAPVGILVFDEEYRLQYSNPRIHDILGTDGATVASTAQRLLNGPILTRGDDMREMAIDFDRPDGETRTLHLSLNSMMLGTGDALVAWVYDVTELCRARGDAERAAHAKSAFLAMMSHEIRTPMNGMATAADLLSETPLSADQASLVRIIRSSAEGLLTIIGDVLDFSKIEAGQMEIEEHPFTLAAVVYDAIRLFQPKANEKHLRLSWDIAAAAPAWVLGDGNRLRQILLNLIGNAIKFTERGQVSVHVTVPLPERLRVQVEDTGIGITGEQKMLLFNPFVQSDASVARRFGGTGLGLSICRGLVKAMGGDIGVDSTPGEGSVFWFEVPMPGCPVPADEPGATSGERRTTLWNAPDRGVAEAARAVVLCAEDNATNREVLGRVLKRLGVVCDMVEDGAEALAILDFDVHGLVLTDLHMPLVDGYQLARRIRDDEDLYGDGRRIPVVALSADGVKGTAEACREAGMDGHLSKPIRIDELEAALLEHLPAIGDLRTPADAPSAPVPPVPVHAAALDLSLLRGLVGDDPEAVLGALEGFRDTAAELVDVVERIRSLDHDDETARVACRTAVHSLKSASRYIGAGTLSDIAAAVESALASGDWAGAAAHAGGVRSAFQAVLERIATVRAAPD